MGLPDAGMSVKKKKKNQEKKGKKKALRGEGVQDEENQTITCVRALC